MREGPVPHKQVIPLLRAARQSHFKKSIETTRVLTDRRKKVRATLIKNHNFTSNKSYLESIEIVNCGRESKISFDICCKVNQFQLTKIEGVFSQERLNRHL